MPTYVLNCPNCAKTQERTVTIAQCDKQLCECGVKLEIEISPVQSPVDAARFRMNAIMSDGTRVPGHFGRPPAKKGFGP